MWIVPRRPVGAIGLTLVAYRHSENRSTRIRPVRSRIAMRHVPFGLEHQTSVRTGGENEVAGSPLEDRTKSRKGTICYSGHVSTFVSACAFHVRTTFRSKKKKKKKKKDRRLSFVLTRYDESH
ncbi:unnamed protein product, partial [Heterotrigona itama]